MRKLILTMAAMAVTLTMSAQKTATLYVSQGFQGPECYEKVTVAVDKDGYMQIFNGKDFAGWRGYGLTRVTDKWVVEDGCIKFDSQKKGRGGDIIFAHKFKNFELEMEWKIAEGGNSGIFYLAQETCTPDGKNLEPIYISCPECQVLDNENHPDAKMGVDGNRKSSSLYDMIPAKPQNAKPFGQWNKVKIRVKDGVVTHFQNGVQVLQYTLWTPEWIEMLQASKFSEKNWPVAFELLKECGGPNHEGLIGMQDHGDTVWYRNIKVKEL